jgi:hypothetical protein
MPAHAIPRPQAHSLVAPLPEVSLLLGDFRGDVFRDDFRSFLGDDRR